MSFFSRHYLRVENRCQGTRRAEHLDQKHCVECERGGASVRRAFVREANPRDCDPEVGVFLLAWNDVNHVEPPQFNLTANGAGVRRAYSSYCNNEATL